MTGGYSGKSRAFPHSKFNSVSHTHTHIHTHTHTHTHTQVKIKCILTYSKCSRLLFFLLNISALLTNRKLVTAIVVQEVKKSFSNQKVASSIPCRSVLEQDTEPLIAPDVQCAISVNVKCVYMC